MPTTFPTVPYRPVLSADHDGLHETLRQWMLTAVTAINTLENGSVAGAINASNISSGTLGVAYLPAGSRIVVDKVKNGGSWPGARPTARTDVDVEWVGNTDPGGIAINGDAWDQEP